MEGEIAKMPYIGEHLEGYTCYVNHIVSSYKY